MCPNLGKTRPKPANLTGPRADLGPNWAKFEKMLLGSDQSRHDFDQRRPTVAGDRPNLARNRPKLARLRPTSWLISTKFEQHGRNRSNLPPTRPSLSRFRPNTGLPWRRNDDHPGTRIDQHRNGGGKARDVFTNWSTDVPSAQTHWPRQVVQVVQRRPPPDRRRRRRRRQPSRSAGQGVQRRPPPDSRRCRHQSMAGSRTHSQRLTPTTVSGWTRSSSKSWEDPSPRWPRHGVLYNRALARCAIDSRGSGVRRRIAVVVVRPTCRSGGAGSVAARPLESRRRRPSVHGSAERTCSDCCWGTLRTPCTSTPRAVAT